MMLNNVKQLTRGSTATLPLQYTHIIYVALTRTQLLVVLSVERLTHLTHPDSLAFLRGVICYTAASKTIFTTITCSSVTARSRVENVPTHSAVVPTLYHSESLLAGGAQRCFTVRNPQVPGTRSYAERC